jgi:hypothetical protein
MFDDLATPPKDSEELTDVYPYVDNTCGIIEEGDYAHLHRMMRGMVSTHLDPGPLPWIAKAIGVYAAQACRFGPVPGVYDMMVCYIIVYWHISGTDSPDAVYNELLSAEDNKQTKGSIAYTYREAALQDRSFADALFSTVRDCIQSRGPCLTGNVNAHGPGSNLQNSEDARPLIVPQGMTPPEECEYGDLSEHGINTLNLVGVTNKLIRAAYEDKVTDLTVQEFLFNESPFSSELEDMRNDVKRPFNFYEYDKSQREYILTSTMSPTVLAEQGVLMDRAFDELKAATSAAKARLKSSDKYVESQNASRVPGKTKPIPGSQKESPQGGGREEGRPTPQ